MNHLKQKNFDLGKEQTGFNYKSSSDVGKLAQTATPRDQVPWATRQTHFGLGIDSENKTSDYAMRFQQSANDLSYNSNNNQLMRENKAKIELDSTIIGAPGAKIQEATTTGDNTQDKFQAAK